MAIEFYKEYGELGYLANYSNHGFTKNGIFYKTVEHYYQSEKFDNEEIKNKIINALTPKIASNIGRDRSNIRKNNFKDIKLDVMYDGILEKFRQNRDIAYKLIETRNSEIAEATIDEYYWGIGKDKTGKNNIGKILVKVREEIKREILENILNKAKNCKVVYIMGHQNPDADSIFSSCLLSNILNSLGIVAKPVILNNYSYARSDELLIKDNLKDEIVILDKTMLSSDDKFIIVDHNNLGDLNREQILGSIDHHVISGDVFDTLEIEYASTGLLIYDLFKEVYKFSDIEKYLIYLTVLADTEYLCSTRYKEEDKKLLQSLNVDFEVDILKKKYFVTNDFSQGIKMSLESNYKEYNIEGNKIKRYMIYSYKKEFDLYFDDYLEYVKNMNDKEVLLIWCDYETMKTYYYYNNSLRELNFILTSTNLIYKKMKEEGILE